MNKHLQNIDRNKIIHEKKKKLLQKSRVILKILQVRFKLMSPR